MKRMLKECVDNLKQCLAEVEASEGDAGPGAVFGPTVFWAQVVRAYAKMMALVDFVVSESCEFDEDQLASHIDAKVRADPLCTFFDV